MLDHGNFLVAESEAVLLVFVERVGYVLQERAKILEAAVGFLAIAQQATWHDIIFRVLATLRLRYDMVDSHIIELDLLAAICAMTSVFM